MAFDDLDSVIAGNGRGDLAAVIARRIRVADAFAVWVLNKNCYRVRAADLFGPNRLPGTDIDHKITFIAIISKRSGYIGTNGPVGKSNTSGALRCNAAR